MKSKQYWAGAALLALGLATAEAAPVKRVTITGGRVYRGAIARPTARLVTAPRTVKRSFVAKQQTVTRVATRPAPTSVRRVAPVRAVTPAKRRLYAQATPSEKPPATIDSRQTAPGNRTTTPAERAAIAREAEPLMLRALAAYYVTDEAMLQSMRQNGWSFTDLATAGNMALRSRRSYWTVANAYDQRRDWVALAQEWNVPADDIYVAANTPRYALVRPTYEEELRMMAPPVTETTIAAAPASPTPPPAAATTTTQPAAAAPPAAATTATPQTPGAVTTAPATAVPGAVTTPQTAPVQPAPRMMTHVERVAASRLETTPREPEMLLRRVVATYYALPHSTIRELESQGWTLNDILVAGNLAHRSEATFEEVAALRNAGNDWNAVSERIGVATETLHQPTLPRRILPAPAPVMEDSKRTKRAAPAPRVARRP
jgi:hypothetical protein